MDVAREEQSKDVKVYTREEHARLTGPSTTSSNVRWLHQNHSSVDWTTVTTQDVGQLSGISAHRRHTYDIRHRNSQSQCKISTYPVPVMGTNYTFS